MSETPDSAGASAAGASRPLDYTTGTLGPSGSGMLRLGGALGIAACAVGLLVMVAACAGLNAALVLSMVPVALSLPGLVISVVGAVAQKRLIAEDTHVLHALFANVAGLLGGLLEMAAWQNWPLFHH
jgi:hypothetical protein